MLKDGDVSLRPVEIEDFELFKRWYNDYKITRKVSFREFVPRSSFEQVKWIEGKIKDRSLRYFIIIVESIEVGYAAYYDLDNFNHNVHLSIVLADSSFRNKGIGTKSVGILERYLLMERNIRKVRVHIVADNEPSLKLFAKCGYLEEGRLIKEFYRNGEYKDVVLLYKFLR